MSIENDLILTALKQRLGALQMGLLQMYDQKAQLDKSIEGNRVAINELARLIEPLEKEKEPDGAAPNLQ